MNAHMVENMSKEDFARITGFYQKKMWKLIELKDLLWKDWQETTQAKNQWRAYANKLAKENLKLKKELDKKRYLLMKLKEDSKNVI
jgi:hypothetical protein